MAGGEAKHLLVIRLSAMGDVAMVVPVLVALAKQHPSVCVTVLTREFMAPIVQNVPGVSVKVAEVKTRHKGFFGLWRLFTELRKLRIDAVADLHNVLRSNVLTLFFRLSGIAVEQMDKGRQEKRALTAWREKALDPIRSTHERYADVFRALGFALELQKEHLLPRQHWNHVKGLPIVKDTKWVGIAPFAAFKGKVYPPRQMEAVLLKLSQQKGIWLWLFGGGNEEKDQLELWAQKFEHCTNVAGKLSFSEELALISNLDALLAMDSGNAHLAAMYGVPTITLWGVTHPCTGFYPYAQPSAYALLSDRATYPFIPTSVYGSKWPGGYENAMQTIAPQQVIDKINEVLGIHG